MGCRIHSEKIRRESPHIVRMVSLANVKILEGPVIVRSLRADIKQSPAILGDPWSPGPERPGPGNQLRIPEWLSDMFANTFVKAEFVVSRGLECEDERVGRNVRPGILRKTIDSAT